MSLFSMKMKCAGITHFHINSFEWRLILTPFSHQVENNGLFLFIPYHIVLWKWKWPIMRLVTRPPVLKIIIIFQRRSNVGLLFQIKCNMWIFYLKGLQIKRFKSTRNHRSSSILQIRAKETITFLKSTPDT